MEGAIMTARQLIPALAPVVLFLVLPFSALRAADDASYRKGMQYYLEKKFLLAIGSFRAAIDSGYQEPKAYFYLANAYVNNEDYDKALEQYKYALEAGDDPSLKAMIHHNTGYVYYLKKDYARSIDNLNRAFALDANVVQAYWYKGMAYFKLRDRTNTISEWETYLVLAPNGRESDNIRRALSILKSDDFDFDRYAGLVPDPGAGAGSNTNRPGLPDVDPLIDIEGVLNEVKPADKGKAVDEGLEGLER